MVEVIASKKGAVEAVLVFTRKRVQTSIFFLSKILTNGEQASITQVSFI